MARSGPVPGFFQVLVGDFSEKLKIPRAFISHFNGPAHCTLEGPDGKCWEVVLEEKDNDLFFHKGWKKFRKGNVLKEGDFLVFEYDGGSWFNVTIYDESACEMDMEDAKAKRGAAHVDPRGDSAMPERAETRIIEIKSKHYCFKRTMENHRLYQLHIPVALARAKRLVKKKTVIKLLDPINRSWNVVVTPLRDGRILMGKGWCDCHKSNQIEVGNTLVFEFVKEHVKLHIYRAEGCNVILTGPKVVD